MSEHPSSCGDECPGCTCHISPPCSHCVENHDQIDVENGEDDR